MKTKEVAMETVTKKKKIWLVVHTTCGIEFEIIADKDGEPDFGRSISGPWYVTGDSDDDDYDEDAEGKEKASLNAVFERDGWELMGEIWS